MNIRLDRKSVERAAIALQQYVKSHRPTGEPMPEIQTLPWRLQMPGIRAAYRAAVRLVAAELAKR